MGNASTLQPNEQADTDLLRLFTKILLPPGGTGTLPIAAGFPWFFA